MRGATITFHFFQADIITMAMQILIVDDVLGVRNSLGDFLKEKHDIRLAQNAEEALQILEKTAFDLVITDIQLPGISGLELLKKGKEISSQTSFMLMTAFGSIEQAVQAIQLGGDDYFLKPFEFSEITHRVKNIEDLRAWKAETALRVESGRGIDRLIGCSEFMDRARQFVLKVAEVNSPVLLLGPTGSGKEVLARAIHESSSRASKPFVAINCASLTAELMESELFGHEKGAFTGASSSKPGKFELARGGTLFLDEIGELPITIQAKLLRVLQEKEFFRVGGIRQIKSDVRVIAATHRPLKKMVVTGHFREDLFFRLNVLNFELEPLCNRTSDLPILLSFFWEKLTRELGKKVELSHEARAILLAYLYPGNIREMQNVLERLIVLGPDSGVISANLLPPEFGSTTTSPEDRFSSEYDLSQGLNVLLEEIESRLIQETMDCYGHNQVKASQALKIARGALQYKLKKYGIKQGSGHDQAA